jgi:Leucine-rich repeat (LRR) protein
MKKTLLILALFFTTSLLFSNNFNDDLTTTAIPDPAFEQELINLGYDIAPIDGSVPTANISGVTSLYLGYLGIENLDGIEDFAALENLTFQGNQAALTSIDLTSNLNLKTLQLSGFPNLASIDITGLLNLTDILLSNLAGINSLDYSNMSSLNKVQISRLSNLLAVNVSGLSALTEFSISNSPLMNSLDLSPLTSLNQLVLSNNTQLTTLNLGTGTTAAINYVQLNRNTLLTCVEVDAGVPLIGMPNWNQNNGYIFNEDCANPETFVPDDNFEAYLEANSMGNGILNDDKVTTANINTITALDVSGKSISNLTGIKDFVALIDLNASSNLLSSVDVSKNTVLEQLFLNDNSLTAIDVRQNTVLKQLWVRQNNLTILDVSKNTNLEWFVASINSIQNLDLSLNTNLNAIEIHTNDLQTLNLKNISQTSLYFDAQLNPDLTCIEVDNPSAWTTNFSSQIDNTASFNADCSYPTTNIPDAAFENYLETHDRNRNVVALGDPTSMGNGIAGDMIVYTHRINTVTTLDVSNIGLSLLTGLEDFRDIEIFSAFGGNPGLTSADFSSNLKLKKITFTFNSNATSVAFGNLPDVEYIQLGYCNIASVDLSGLPNLKEFKDFDSKLTTLDVSSNLNLELLAVQGGILTALDVSANPDLKNISVTGNQITSFDFSNNPIIEILNVNNNQLTSLDLSNNDMLTQLNAANNNLTSLNLKNGNNTILLGSFGPGFGNFPFDIRNNPDLTCIEVNDLTYANTNWTAKDPQHTFNTDCFSTWTVMTNPTTTAALLTVAGLDADNDGNITIAEAAAFTGTLDLSGQSLTDVEGLQAFNNVSVINLQNNNITDFSPLTDASIPTIQKSTGATKVQARTGAFNLEALLISNNNAVQSLDVSKLSKLKKLVIKDNPNLITVSVKNGNNASITEFDSSNTPNLSCILVDDPNATYLTTWTKDAKNNFVADEAQCRAEVLSIDNFDVKNNVFLYQNPVKDYLKIDLTNQLQIQNIQIYNVIGKLVKETKSLEVDFTKLSKGIYLLKMITNKGIATKKVIKD